MNNIQLKIVSILLLLSTLTITLVEGEKCKVIHRLVPGPRYTQNTIFNCSSVTVDSQHPIKSLLENFQAPQLKVATHIVITKSNIPVVDNSTFDSLFKLQELQLNGDNITDIQPFAFLGLLLNKIQLTNNKLTEIKENAFAGLETLKELDISFNQITILENVNETTNLELLNVSKNSLVKINNNCFNGMSKLLLLDLSYNNLTTLDNLNGLNNLQELNASNNNLLIIKQNSFQELTKLKILNVFNNRLTTIAHINEAHSLVTLNIAYNLLQTINENDFQSFQLLQSLDLSNNYITDINQKLFKNLHNLTHIFLSNNTIETFPNDLIYKSIQYIDLSINNINKIKCDQFQGIVILNRNFIFDFCHCGPETTSINFGENELTEIPKGSLAHLTKLTFLNLTKNYIRNIDVDAFENLHNLTTLLISNNLITTIHMGTFFHLSSLKTLDLSYNKIENFTLGIFTGVNNLEVLNLSHNSITLLNDDIFVHLNHLYELYLHGNPLVYPSGNDLPSSLKKLSIHFEKIDCEELRSMIQSAGQSNVKQGVELKGPNVHGIACQPKPEEENNERRGEKEFLQLKETANAIHISLILIIVLFVILFISHTMSWCHNHFISKEYYLKKNGQTCSLTLLTEDDQD